LNLCLSA